VKRVPADAGLARHAPRARLLGSGDRVVSRWIAEGHNRARPVRLWGITISRFDDGEIVEDWSASDTLGVLRQLGVRRLLLLGLDWLRDRAARVS
jgi:hypothetical protein